MEVTFQRAFKIWWSIAWRNWVVAIPVLLIMMPIMFFLIPHQVTGQPPMRPEQIPGFTGKFFAIWLVSMVAFIFMQTLSIRWALKTRWSDFRLDVVPNGEPVKELEK